MSHDSNGTLRNPFTFYEKPMCTTFTIMECSVMGWLDKHNILKQEVCRRMDRISPDRPIAEVVNILDKFTDKMKLSGFNLEKERGDNCRN